MEQVVTGKQDVNLEYIKKMCKDAVKGMVKAMEKMEYGMKYKAFELSNIPEEQRPAFCDLLGTAIAIEIKEQIPDTLNTITYDTRIENDKDDSNKFSYWLTAFKEKPDYSKAVADEQPIETLYSKPAEGKLIEDCSGNPVLIGASGMGHVDSKQHIRMDC